MFLSTRFGLHAAWIACLLVLCSASSAQAQVVLYYEPETGNVSFDTADSSSGEIWAYGLVLNTRRLDDLPDNLRFRPENHVRVIDGSSFFIADPTNVSDASTSTTLAGYFTIGDVLPPGLSEESWRGIFGSVYNGSHLSSPPAGHIFFDHAESSSDPPAATLVYGQPDRPFDNRWDIVDPNDLDWASSARLVYDPATGEVVIDTTGTDGGHISLFILESGGAFLAENFTPWLDVPFSSANSDVIGFAADAIEPGVYSAGLILPTGLTLDEVRSTFTSARFIGRAGFGGASFDVVADGENFQVAMAVPEPVSVLLLAFASAAAARTRPT